MNFGFNTLLGLTSGLLGMVVGLSMFFLVLWPAPRHRENQLMAIYMATVFLWGLIGTLSSFMVLIGIDPSLPFYGLTHIILINGLAIFALATYYAGISSNPWARWSLWIGIVMAIGFIPAIYTGSISQVQGVSPEGFITFTIAPFGLVGVAAANYFFFSSIGVLWANRRGRAGALLAGALIMTASVLTNLLPVIASYSTDILAAAIAGVLFARAILRENLFNPMNTLNRELAASNERLQHAAAEIATSEANLAALVENTSDSIWSIDTDYRLITFNSTINQVFKLGYGVTLEPDMQIVDQVPPDQRQIWTDLYKRALGGERFSVEQPFEFAQLNVRATLEISLNPIRADDGMITGVAVFGRDVTERKHVALELTQAREAAELASKAKSAFMANMSHELRTPLNAIIGYSEMLQEEAVDLDLRSVIPDLQKIQDAGRHLLGLINDVLDISKIEAGKMELYLEDFDLPTLINEVLATVQPLATQRHNTLMVERAAELGQMHADQIKVRQVLFNLLSNACKFTERGSVRLRVTKMKNAELSMQNGALPELSIRFEVIDSGIGMSAEQIARLFQPFSQADVSTTRKYGGTGLGLAISRHFCEIMGGTIAIMSVPDQGSTFTVTLPMQLEAPVSPLAPISATIA